MEWEGVRYSDTPTVEASRVVAAPPERLWPVVSDISVLADWSQELQSVAWLEGVTSAFVGARFIGYNRHPAVGQWTSTSTVVECDEPRCFAWAVGDPDRPAASWRFELEAGDGGTTVTQWARLGPGPSLLSVAVAELPEQEGRIIASRLREWRSGMERNLEAIKAMVEGGDRRTRRGLAGQRAPG